MACLPALDKECFLSYFANGLSGGCSERKKRILSFPTKDTKECVKQIHLFCRNRLEELNDSLGNNLIAEDFPGKGSDGQQFAYNAGYLGLIPGSGRCPGGGHGNPL